MGSHGQREIRPLRFCQSPPHRAVARRDGANAARRRRKRARCPDRRDRAEGDPAGGALRLRPSAVGARCARQVARNREQEPRTDLAHRSGLSRHDHAAGDPAQHSGEPSLVHCLYALPAGNQSGAPRGPLELSDPRQRSNRARYRQRFAARRSDRGGGGDGDGASGDQIEGGRILRRRAMPAADNCRAADPRRADGLEAHHRRPLQRPQSRGSVRCDLPVSGCPRRLSGLLRHRRKAPCRQGPGGDRCRSLGAHTFEAAWRNGR